jgi:hypothetical protein
MGSRNIIALTQMEACWAQLSCASLVNVDIIALVS